MASVVGVVDQLLPVVTTVVEDIVAGCNLFQLMVMVVPMIGIGVEPAAAVLPTMLMVRTMRDAVVVPHMLLRAPRLVLAPTAEVQLLQVMTLLRPTWQPAMINLCRVMVRRWRGLTLLRLRSRRGRNGASKSASARS